MRTPDAASTLEEWLNWLQQLSPREIELGLERVEQVQLRMSLPTPACVITVGGTNGKGSTVAMLSEILHSDGRIVGQYTSPHVLHYCERVRVDGVPATESEMLAAFASVEHAREGVPLTYFEFGTLAASTSLCDAQRSIPRFSR